MQTLSAFSLRLLVCALLLIASARADRPHRIKIDGQFDDWTPVKRYTDPLDAPDGSVLQQGAPDVHEDLTYESACDFPPHVWNPDVDLLEYALTHDEDNVYAYFRVAGNLSRTAMASTEGGAGRSYIQVAIDMDDNEDTGYQLWMGGYWPTDWGYDMHFELELYNGSANNLHVLLHAMNSTEELNAQLLLQQQGYLFFDGPANYKNYTEWVWYAPSQPVTAAETARCASDPTRCSGPFNVTQKYGGGQLLFVQDKSPGPLFGSMRYAFGGNGSQFEMSVPFGAFLRFPDGSPVMRTGIKLTASFATETSSQFSTPQEWVSDASWPIRGYVVEPFAHKSAVNFELTWWQFALVIGGIVAVALAAVLATALGCILYYRRSSYRQLP